VADTTKEYGTKKMPANGGRAQPKIGPRDAESGAAHRCAARLSAITHIGYVYADEPSIRRECDADMTHVKQTPVHLRTNAAETGPSPATGKKKACSSEQASNYFLGGE
jgi:hypothetical protein